MTKEIVHPETMYTLTRMVGEIGQSPETYLLPIPSSYWAERLGISLRSGTGMYTRILDDVISIDYVCRNGRGMFGTDILLQIEAPSLLQDDIGYATHRSSQEGVVRPLYEHEAQGLVIDLSHIAAQAQV